MPWSRRCFGEHRPSAHVNTVKKDHEATVSRQVQHGINLGEIDRIRRRKIVVRSQQSLSASGIPTDSSEHLVHRTVPEPRVVKAEGLRNRRADRRHANPPDVHSGLDARSPGDER